MLKTIIDGREVDWRDAPRLTEREAAEARILDRLAAIDRELDYYPTREQAERLRAEQAELEAKLANLD